MSAWIAEKFRAGGLEFAAAPTIPAAPYAEKCLGRRDRAAFIKRDFYSDSGHSVMYPLV